MGYYIQVGVLLLLQQAMACLCPVLYTSSYLHISHTDIPAHISYLSRFCHRLPRALHLPADRSNVCTYIHGNRRKGWDVLGWHWWPGYGQWWCEAAFTLGTVNCGEYWTPTWLTPNTACLQAMYLHIMYAFGVMNLCRFLCLSLNIPGCSSPPLHRQTEYSCRVSWPFKLTSLDRKVGMWV